MPEMLVRANSSELSASLGHIGRATQFAFLPGGNGTATRESANVKILWRRGGQRCYRFGFESTSTLERSDGRPHSEQPPDRRTSS
jgi:hypothetical protein